MDGRKQSQAEIFREHMFGEWVEEIPDLMEQTAFARDHGPDSVPPNTNLAIAMLAIEPPEKTPCR